MKRRERIARVAAKKKGNTAASSSFASVYHGGLGLPERSFKGRAAENANAFTVRFLEDVLSANPDNIEALTFLGHTYTARKMFEKGLEMDLRLVSLRPNDGLVHYNLACSYSLLGRLGEAAGALEKAVALGYREFGWMNKDPDLENLRATERFAELVRKLKNL